MPWTSPQSRKAAERVVRDCRTDILAGIDTAALAVRDHTMNEDYMRQIWDDHPWRKPSFNFDEAREQYKPEGHCPQCNSTNDEEVQPVETGYGYGWGLKCTDCGHMKYAEPWE